MATFEFNANPLGFGILLACINKLICGHTDVHYFIQCAYCLSGLLRINNSEISEFFFKQYKIFGCLVIMSTLWLTYTRDLRGITLIISAICSLLISIGYYVDEIYGP